MQRFHLKTFGIRTFSWGRHQVGHRPQMVYLFFQAVKYILTVKRCLKDQEKGQQKNRSTGRENRAPKFYENWGPKFHENWGPKFRPDGTLEPGFEIEPREFYSFKL